MSSKNNKTVKHPEIKESPHLVKMSADQCKKLCASISLEYHEGFENRVIERITTTEVVDRDGDIIRAKGIDNKQFRIEPVVLYAHDRYSPPVGKSLKEWIDNKISGWRSWDLYFDSEIDPSGTSDLVFRFVKSGAMRGGSIGFLPMQVKWDHTDEERTELGLGKWGGEFLKILKLEHSACSIPANQEALAVGLKSLDKKIIQGNLSKSDLDVMEKENLLDGDLIDVFCKVLGVEKTISIPPSKEEKEKSDNMITLNLNTDSLTEKLIETNSKIEKLSEDITGIQESFTERFESLITASERLVSVIEQKNQSESIYDQEDEIRDMFKLDNS